MTETHDEHGTHITVPASIFYLLLIAAGLGGAGGYGILGPQLEAEAIRSCFDNSETALEVAAQHGQEFVDLRKSLRDATKDRYTGADAEKHWREQDRRDATQDRRINYLEQQLERK